MAKLKIEKYFSGKDKKPKIEFTKSNIQITDSMGVPLFVQKDCEFPNYFSELSRKITASRYFYGEHGTLERENSFKTLVDRVTKTYKKWGIKQGYFDERQAKIFQEELEILTSTQKMAFNSPVWFNVGTEKYDSRKSQDERGLYIISDRNREIEIPTDYGILKTKIKKGDAIPVPSGKNHLYPQTSACFIQSVDDTMEDIMNLSMREARLFRHGSGTGTDLSTLRSFREKLSGGGNPSGPLAYLIFFDDVAGIVKSGGKTRRAAKMDSLKITHPDILEFIVSKKKEQEKIEILRENGLDYKEAIESGHFQNTNISVVVTDEFMEAAEKDKNWKTIPVHNKEMLKEMPKYKAKDLLYLIAEGTHACGDPGIQYHDTINDWHTCKNSGKIEASNPCSEYMFINDSSCNLASLNLRGFIDEKGKFNTKDFESAIRTTAIAMDLNYDNSSFPTKKIAENSHKFRALGMGYANLGGLLMSLALPYDSDESRNIAAAITALMTGKVYETSIEMAKKIGTFEEYEKNKDSMMQIIRKHHSALKNIDKNKLKGLENILEEAYNVWERVVKNGEKYGFRNAQATVLAPTGTIGFMMDCDTKGIEPEFGLVQTKLLAEGGTLKIANGIVPLALKNLDYKEEDIKNIINYILENKTAEGCEILKKEHLPIFDCANKPKNAKRFIDYLGHLKMMAAVQPFLSGAISKTVNLPEEATVKQIKKIYIDAWKMGLKSVSIYRNESKSGQPLSLDDNSKKTKKKNLEKIAQEPIIKAKRKKLPITAPSLRHKFNIAGHEGYLHIGLYEDGSPGEVFISMSKEGSTIGGLMNALALSTSMNLQYGVPLETLVNKFKNSKFDPRGIVLEGHEEIKTATSLIDYIFNFLGKTYLEKEKAEEAEFKPWTVEEFKKVYEPESEENLNENPKEEKENKDKKNKDKFTESPREQRGFCPICGDQLIKRGHCEEVCEECDYVSQNGCGS